MGLTFESTDFEKSRLSSISEGEGVVSLLII